MEDEQRPDPHLVEAELMRRRAEEQARERRRATLGPVAEFLGSPVAGVAVAWLLWLVLPKTINALGAECVSLVGETFCSWPSMATVGGVIGLGVGFVLHWALD